MSDFLYIIVLTLLMIKIFFAYLESNNFLSTKFLSYLFSIKPDIVEFTSNFSINYLIKLCFLLIWISCLHFIVFKAMEYILKKCHKYISAREILEICINPFLWVQ